MIVIVGALALLVGVIVSLTLESWWILVAVMAVHGLLSAIVIGFTLRQVDKTGGKPDPVTEARVEAAGTQAEAGAYAARGGRVLADLERPGQDSNLRPAA
jgi:membrane protein implicated in regulation of membrane protease activity